MEELKCRICGSTNLSPDPSAYYEHAFSANGAPLLCLDGGSDHEPGHQIEADKEWARHQPHTAQ